MSENRMYSKSIYVYYTEGTTYLEETDSNRLLTEALTAEVKTVLADDTGLVSAETASTSDMSPLHHRSQRQDIYH